MDKYRELAELLRHTGGNTSPCIMQGIVTKVAGAMCEVKIGGITVPDVRLRASEIASSGELLVVPKVGTAVIMGSLSGDLSQLVVLAVDSAEQVVINGGKLGGLVNIETLTAKLNAVIDTFNRHTHTAPNGPTTPPTSFAQRLNKADYEDTKIKH